MHSILPEHCRRALRAAFPHTLPILAGFLFLGISYGIYMHSLGFSFLWPMMMSLTIFAGSMEFVAANLLLQAFDPLYAFLMALTVNARHLFYGFSMLEKFRETGAFKPYLIFGLCDETFSIHCAVDPPDGMDAGWFRFFITLLNQCYWVVGATLGGLIGGCFTFDAKGLDFVMTALFVVIFLSQWQSGGQHLAACIGVGSAALCLILFGASNFILPSMALILAVLTLLRRPIERREVQP